MQQVTSETAQTTFSFLIQSLLPSLFILGGLVIAALQVREAARSYRATVLLQLTQEWNSAELYAAVNYIHKLRREWKIEEPEFNRWMPLAQAWLDEHNPNNQTTNNPEYKRLMDEWNNRRIASQFLSKMGYMMSKGYIKPKDFFAFVPEAPRLIVVLEPIDFCIVKYYRSLEIQNEDWDRAFSKVGFQFIKDLYPDWFKISGIEQLSRQDNI